MQRIEIRTDRLNTPETVADYLGLTKDTVIRMARGRHCSGRKIKAVEVLPRKLRFKAEDIAEYVKKYPAASH
jgi:excisionase family DNA binding protein